MIIEEIVALSLELKIKLIPANYQTMIDAKRKGMHLKRNQSKPNNVNLHLNIIMEFAFIHKLYKGFLIITIVLNIQK